MYQLSYAYHTVTLIVKLFTSFPMVPALTDSAFFLPFPPLQCYNTYNCAVTFRVPCEMGLDFRPAAIYNGGIYMSFWNVLLVIIVILAILLVVLYILGSRMQKRQAEQQTMIDASKQTVSILAIDKKKLKSEIPVSRRWLLTRLHGI
mgnify:CR=1 FL=1